MDICSLYTKSAECGRFEFYLQFLRSCHRIILHHALCAKAVKLSILYTYSEISPTLYMYCKIIFAMQIRIYIFLPTEEKECSIPAEGRHRKKQPPEDEHVEVDRESGDEPSDGLADQQHQRGRPSTEPVQQTSRQSRHDFHSVISIHSQ